MRRAVWIIVPLLAALAACEGSPPPKSTSAAAPAACRSRPQGSRWASGGGRYRQTAAYGRENGHWLYEVGGVAAGDSLVYVYDVPQSRIVVLDTGLRPVRWFGRKGSGPGDLESSVDMGRKGRGWRWLDLAGDSLLVFDGIRAQLFAADGRFLAQVASDRVGTPALSEGIDRVAWAGGVVAPSGGYDVPALQPAADRYRWDLNVLTAGSMRRVVSLRLAPLPGRGRGVPFRGPEQALPVWALRAGCVVAGDGTGAWLLRAALAGGPADTMRLSLPRVKLPTVDRDELARLTGMASKGEQGYLPPTASRRISALQIDPDGYAWLLLTQDSTHIPGRVEVVRVALETGAAVRDTVPAFPAAFGAPGVFYARTNDRISGEAEVVRYQRSP